MFIGSTSIVNIYHIKTVSSIQNSDQLLPFSKLEFLCGRRRFSSSPHEVRKRSHRNLKRPLFNPSPNPTQTSRSIANKTQICLDFKVESTILMCGHQSLLLATRDSFLVDRFLVDRFIGGQFFFGSTVFFFASTGFFLSLSFSLSRIP